MKALAIRHVKIEHLGLLEPILQELGIVWEYLDTSEGQNLKGALEEYSLLIVLGGYMGAYEEKMYPFLSYEYRIMEKALKKDIPILGICLGSQMLARVLGARVYRGERGKEIGWMKVYKTGEHDYFRDFPQELTVFQWHGDTFDLPSGAVRVYSSEKYENQAFVYNRAVGLQFHIEVDINMVHEWMQTSKEELSEEAIKINEILGSYADGHIALLHRLLKVMLFNE
ncbi:MAG: gamma-glutamyl-gamma-aminobutyrate hydrolase family protein [Aquificaceae bacterium]|uniref:type 1 glutamine amidotransferase n=1 Tax=Hydrogenobacter sp. Uz 6-8 TaxID=3384828 RepID=UPI0030B52D62